MALNTVKASTHTDKMSQLAKTLATTSDVEAQKLLTRALVLEAKQMINEIQNPFDTLMDQVVTGYTISASLALLELGVFDAVPPSGTISAKDLATQCDAEEEMLIRLLRQLTCVNIFVEVKLGQWAHNNNSIILSNYMGDQGRTFYQVCFDEMLPCMLQFHRYLREFGSKDVHTYTDTPHSWYNQMLGKNFWEVLDSTPNRVSFFNKGLQNFASMHPVVAMFPFESALKEGNAADRPLIVDIGGGNGQAIMELRRGCPNLQGEMILQDRPEVIANIKTEDLPGITKMGHDFFTEQPVKNAQLYYIRRVMHDWQDEEAAKIMKAIIPSMAPDSRILMSDMTIPEPVSLKDAGAVWLDLMLMSIGGKERTRRDWKRLAELTGLKLVRIWQEPEKYGTLCVVEYMLVDSKPETGVVEEVPTAHTNGVAKCPRTDGAADYKPQPKASSAVEAEKFALGTGVKARDLKGHVPMDITAENDTQAEIMASPKRSVQVGG